MEKYFVNYNQALALKELGFDMPCIMYIDDEGDLINDDTAEWIRAVKCPLKSQVFEFFRKNHLLGHEINCPFISYSGKLACIKNEGRYELYITDEEQLSLPEDIFYSTDYFEAESKAIDKLIEIVKNK